MLHIYGTSSRQTGDDGVGETNVCPSIKFRQKASTFPIWVQFMKLCDNTPVFPQTNLLLGIKRYSTYDSTYERKSQQESFQSVLSRTISTVVLMDIRNVIGTFLISINITVLIVRDKILWWDSYYDTFVCGVIRLITFDCILSCYILSKDKGLQG